MGDLARTSELEGVMAAASEAVSVSTDGTGAIYALAFVLMDATSADAHTAVFDSRSVREMLREMRVQFVRTELVLGFTFLQSAGMLRDPKRAQKSVQAAILALRTVNRFLAKHGDDEYADICRRRDELRGRLREMTRATRQR